MILLFMCGVLRVSIPSCYLVTALLQADTARALMVPFAVFVLVTAGYDARRRKQR